MNGRHCRYRSSSFPPFFLGARKPRLSQKGQTALESLFVFSMLLFLTFAIANFAVKFHTRNIATYAAFMAARSFQVYGDQAGVEVFEESSSGSGGQKNPTLLAELEKDKVITATRVAEDIFTCSLPWVRVPNGDSKNPSLTPLAGKKDALTRCQEGQRKYQTTNFGKSFKFLSFKNESIPAGNEVKLNEVPGSFRETAGMPDKKNKIGALPNQNTAGRQFLRYGIMKFEYQTETLFNPFNLFSSTMSEEVYVPVLLNPGLELKLKKQEPVKAKDSQNALAKN